MLADDLGHWDELVGWHPRFALVVDSTGESWQSPDQLGMCLHAGDYREVTLHIDRIDGSRWPRLVFRHTLWHEVAHVALTCTDDDHSADPASLMYPMVTPENLAAEPDRPLLEALSKAKP